MNVFKKLLANHQPPLIRIAIPGGQMTSAQLRRIGEAAMTLGIARIAMGPSQTFWLRLSNGAQVHDCESLLDGLAWSAGEIAPAATIVSSLPFHGIDVDTPWLAETHYHDILASFAHCAIPQPIAIGLVDPQVRWMGRQEGAIQFVASPVENYWQLGLRADGPSRPAGPTPYAVHSTFIAETTQRIMATGMATSSVPTAEADSLTDLASHFLHRGWIEQREPIASGTRPLGARDGFIRQLDGRHALGLAAFDFTFPARFLAEAGVLAQQQSLRRIGLSPWRQLLVRDMDADCAAAWRILLANHGVTIRRDPPSSFFWRMDSGRSADMALRAEIIGELDRTLGPAAEISLAIVAGNPACSEAAANASIVIRKRSRALRTARYDLLSREPGVQDGHLIPLAQGISKPVLKSRVLKVAAQLIKARDAAAEKKSEKSPSSLPSAQSTISTPPLNRPQCGECLTQYDAAWGDSASNTPPGTSFAALPTAWQCPVCGAPKSSYTLGSSHRAATPFAGHAA